MEKRVLFVIVTYNGKHWLDRCLGSCGGGDIYVYDNASSDGSADYVAEHFPSAHLVRGEENLGFSRPNNLGMQYALDNGYDYVYLLNQDAWLEEGALEKMLIYAGSHPECGLFSPIQMTDGYTALDRQFAKAMKGGVKFVMAAHWLIPCPVLRRVGLFNEELFPHWGQDDDWCRRLHFCGYKIGIVCGARAVHDRAYREELVEKRVKRDYYTGSLLRLINPSAPLAFQMAFVLFFTIVKSVKYRSLLPFKYLRLILGELPRIRFHRKFQK